MYKPVIRAFFSLLKVKKLDADDINNKLRRACEFYLGDSTISRLKGYAKTCFYLLQTYHSVVKCEPDKIMSACCFRCLKTSIHYILDELYVV